MQKTDGGRTDRKLEGSATDPMEKEQNPVNNQLLEMQDL